MAPDDFWRCAKGDSVEVKTAPRIDALHHARQPARPLAGTSPIDPSRHRRVSRGQALCLLGGRHAALRCARPGYDHDGRTDGAGRGLRGLEQFERPRSAAEAGGAATRSITAVRAMCTCVPSASSHPPSTTEADGQRDGPSDAGVRRQRILKPSTVSVRRTRPA